MAVTLRRFVATLALAAVAVASTAVGATTARADALPAGDTTINQPAEPTLFTEPTVDPTPSETPSETPPVDPGLSGPVDPAPTVDPTVDPTPSETPTPIVDPTLDPVPTVDPTLDPGVSGPVDPTPLPAPSLPSEPAPSMYPADAVKLTLGEWQTLHYVAPVGKKIKAILFASFGLPDNYQATSCHAETSLAVVSAAVANNVLDVGVNTAVFGDPCSGNQKYLSVVLTLEKDLNCKPASAPKILSAKLRNGRVALGIWAPKKNGGTPITGYEYTIDGGATWAPADPSSTDTSLVITGLDNGTRYVVKVRAVNGAGGGAASNARAVTPRTVAGAPTNVVLTEGNGRIKVDFDAPANTGGSSIIRYGYSINGGSIISFGTVFKPMWMKGLKNGMLHSVKIFAYNAAGWSAPSEAVEATPHK